MFKQIRKASPRFKARIAGGFFLLAILTAASTQFFVHGRLGFAADLVVDVIEVSSMIAVTLLFYDLFRAVNKNLCLLAASSSFVALTLERRRVPYRRKEPRGASSIQSLGARSLTHSLSPYNLVLGLLGESLVSVWLLIMGVDVQRWKEQASA